MHSPPPPPSQTLEFPRVIRDAEGNKPFFFFLPRPLSFPKLYTRKKRGNLGHILHGGKMVFTKFALYVGSRSWKTRLVGDFLTMPLWVGRLESRNEEEEECYFFPPFLSLLKRRRRKKCFESPAAALFCQIKQPLKMCG